MNKEIDALQKARPDLDRAYHRDMEQTKQVAALLRRTFDLGAGDTDLYQAFGWRFWHLLAEGGTIGVILPRQALVAPGYAAWRLSVLQGGSFGDVTVLVNRGGWVFDDVTPQYTIALCSLRKGAGVANGGADARPVCKSAGLQQPCRPCRDQHEGVQILVGNSGISLGAFRRGVGYVPQAAYPPAV